MAARPYRPSDLFLDGVGPLLGALLSPLGPLWELQGSSLAPLGFPWELLGRYRAVCDLLLSPHGSLAPQGELQERVIAIGARRDRNNEGTTIFVIIEQATISLNN